MATEFNEIYERSTYRFSDYDFLRYTTEIREGTLKKYLYSAQVEFQDICKIDLTDRDDTTNQYNNTLDETSMEILSTGIAYYWLSAKVLNSELMKNSIKLSEYSTFSPAELLKQLQLLRETLKKEFYSAIIKYSWRHSDVEGLKA